MDLVSSLVWDMLFRKTNMALSTALILVSFVTFCSCFPEQVGGNVIFAFSVELNFILKNLFLLYFPLLGIYEQAKSVMHACSPLFMINRIYVVY